MFSEYKIDYNDKTDELTIIKTTNNDIVKTNKGKYGIEYSVDINDDLISIVIPEPSLLFGIKLNQIRNF